MPRFENLAAVEGVLEDAIIAPVELVRRQRLVSLGGQLPIAVGVLTHARHAVPGV